MVDHACKWFWRWIVRGMNATPWPVLCVMCMGATFTLGFMMGADRADRLIRARLVEVIEATKFRDWNEIVGEKK